MLKNVLLLFFRNIKKHKGYSFINIFGFAVGIACCMFLVLYIKSELSFDRYHENADRIFRMGVRGGSGDTQFEWGESNAVIARVLCEEYPEVEQTVRFGTVPDSSVRYENKVFYEGNLRYADPSVFQIFSWKLLQGDPLTALKEPYSIVLTETLATKYFGKEDSLGKILHFNNRELYKVTGVMEDVPSNSTLDFDGLCSFQTLYVQGERVNPILVNWLDYNFETCILLQEKADYKILEGELSAILEKHAGRLMKMMGDRNEWFLQPLTDIHLRRPGDGAVFYVYVFSIIALFVLLIACLNFMNLSTARSAKRALEVGLRKVMGADRKRLIIHFLAESVLYSFLAFFIALILVEVFIPFIRSLSGYPLDIGIGDMSLFFPGFVLFVLITGIAAGSYPAFFLSAFRPVSVLKGELKQGASGSRLRNILVVVQFTISIGLLIGTGVIRKQITYLKNKDLGFDKENIVVISLLNEETLQSIDVLKEKLVTDPHVLGTAAASIIPGRYAPLNSKFPQGFSRNNRQLMKDINVGPDFIPTLGIVLKEGRNFSREMASDEGNAVIINETAAKSYGWKEPLGKTIGTFSGSGRGFVQKKVIGVVEDFHLEPLSETIEPLFIGNQSKHRYIPMRYLLVKLDSRRIQEGLLSIESKWMSLFPGIALNSFFLDESLGRQLNQFETSQRIFSTFTTLAVFIACLGLFGLSAFAAEQRTKEIGIRKVLGCSSPGVLFLLGKELLRHVLVAAVVSWPLAYIFLNRWLRSFPYRTNMPLVMFGLSSLLVLGIGMITISYQTVKAAGTDPVKSLHFE
ncbi:MAG: ABC transporter permease [Candidatus Aminicenantes bacterium]|nr:ABC transporter permease [Candidatus Aminicenantes bacterium]